MGRPVSYDVELGILRPRKPVGTMSMANCACGNTLSVTSEGMSLVTMWRLMRWLRQEMKWRGQKAPEVLEDLRRAIDRATLAAPPLPPIG